MVCSTISTGTQVPEVLSSSLHWLAGDDTEIEYEKINSHHGSALNLLKMKLGKGKARLCLSRMGERVLSSLADDGLSKRIDEERCMHFRLSQDDLCCGRIELLGDGDGRTVVKISVKLEVYPGSDVQDVARKLLADSLERSIRRGWGQYPPKIG